MLCLFILFLFSSSPLLASASGCIPIPQNSPIAQPYPQQLADALSSLQSQIQTQLQQHHTASLFAGLISGQQLLWSAGFGVRNRQTDRNPPDLDTLYRLGSVTKTLTAAQAILYDQRGALSLDTPLPSLIPGFQVYDPWQSARAISLRELISHTSGLPRSSPCPIGDPSLGCNITLSQCLARLRAMTLISPPGAGPQYSNLGFSLAGHGMSQVMGLSWEDAIVRDVLRPLGMNNTWPSLQSIPASSLANFATGYGLDQITPAVQLDDGFESPAGSLYSTGRDLATWLAALLRDDAAEGPLLDPMTLREWLKPSTVNDDGVSGFGSPWELFQGYGPEGQYMFFTKNGGISGYLAEIGYIVPLKAGYFMLQSDFSGAFNPVVELLRQIVAGDVAAALQAQQPPTPVPENYKDYEGDYLLLAPHLSPVPKKYRVALGQNPLIPTPSQALLLGGWSEPPPILVPQPLNPTPDIFLVQQAIANYSTCDNFQQGAPGFAQFVRDASGNVTSLSFPGLWYGTFCPKLN